MRLAMQAKSSGSGNVWHLLKLDVRWISEQDQRAGRFVSARDRKMRVTMSRTLFLWCKRQARRIAGSILAVGAYAAMYVADHPVNANVDVVARQFTFSRQSLPEIAGPAIREVRNMHPDLRHIGWYLSAFGAGVALNDLDQDGLAKHLC